MSSYPPPSAPLLHGQLAPDGAHLIEVETGGVRLLRPPIGASRLELWAACVSGDRPDRSLAWDWMRPLNALPVRVPVASVLGLRPPMPGDGVAYRARWVSSGEPVSGWSGLLVLPVTQTATA